MLQLKHREARTDKQSRTRHIVNTWAASCRHHSSEKARPTIPRDTASSCFSDPLESTSGNRVRPTADTSLSHADHQSCRPAALETSNLSSRHAHFFFVSSSTARISSSKICTSSNLYSSFFLGGIIVNGSPSSQRVGIIDRHHQQPKINTESHHDGNV